MIEETNSPCENPQNESSPSVEPQTEEKPQLRKLSELEDEDARNLALFQREKKEYYAKKQWYAVYVTPGHEYQVFDFLNGVDKNEAKKRRRGKAKKEDLKVHIDPEKVLMECYLASVREKVKYSDRIVWKERIQTPGIVFVHCELDHRDVIYDGTIVEYVTGFLSDRTLHRPKAIPDAEMKVFMDMIDEDYRVSIEKPNYKVGQKVLIIDGPAAGHLAELIGTKETISRKEYETDRTGKPILDAEGNPVPKHRLILQLRLNSMMAAQFEIDADKVAPAKDDQKEFEYLD